LKSACAQEKTSIKRHPLTAQWKKVRLFRDSTEHSFLNSHSTKRRLPSLPEEEAPLPTKDFKIGVKDKRQYHD